MNKYEITYQSGTDCTVTETIEANKLWIDQKADTNNVTFYDEDGDVSLFLSRVVSIKKLPSE